MEKEKKTISCSYALLFIIMFAVMCFLCSYIYIDRKLNEEISSTVVKTDCDNDVKSADDNVVTNDECNCEEKIDLSYNDIGVTSFYTDDFQGIYPKFFAEIVNGNISKFAVALDQVRLQKEEA